MENSEYTYINLEYLYEVADGDMDFASEIINDYLTKIPGQLAELEKAVETADYKAAKFIAHKMKSSFQFMGVQRLVEYSYQLEQTEDGLRQVFIDIVAAMKPIVESVMIELKNKLTTL